MITLLLSLLITPFFQYELHALEFTKIDNRAHVYVNDNLVFDSGDIDANPDLLISVDLNSSLRKGKNTVKIQVFNGSLLTPFIEDEQWEIRYDYMVNSESMDYIHETGDDSKNGLVHEYSFVIIVP